MMHMLPFDVVELVPCPALPVPILDAPLSPGAPGAPLRETAFREDAWLPEDIDGLRAAFLADEGLQAIADRLGRTLAAVSTKIADLGLRRNSSRPWTEMEDAYLAQNYGEEATSAIAGSFGRSAAAIYARARLLGLTEGNPPDYTEWELAQLRAGYAQGIPVTQLATLIGRPASGIAAVASRLGIRHANSPPDWTEAEQQRALALAETGLRYNALADRLADEGFPRRLGRAVGQTLHRLGYGRGWGRSWLAEEDDLLRHAYAHGDSLAPLQQRLGRSRTAIAHHAGELGLRGAHARPNGWRTEPSWTDEQIAVLRRDYGRVATPELAARLGRKKSGVFMKAWALGLRHGYIRPFSADEERAIRLAREHGVSLTDLSAALGRDPAVVSKHAIRMGIPFATRVNRAQRGRRAGRRTVTVDTILALDGRSPADLAPRPRRASLARQTGAGCSSATAHGLMVAMPDVPPVSATMLRAMHQAGLLRTVASARGIVLVATLPPR